MSALIHDRVPAVAEDDVRRALDVVIDPELDEPITDLGFVRSISVTELTQGTGVTDVADLGTPGVRVEVHLRLPTSFCSPSFAYLMASDSKDAVTAMAGVAQVLVELDDHHDSDIINVGLAADAGYLGTFRHEAESDLDELRSIFRRKAHTAAMERALTALLRARPELAETEVGHVVLGELPDDETTASLLRRRTAIGLGNHPAAPVLVDENGVGYAASDVPMALRRARSTRISIDGNAHFCRGLLATRYPGSEQDQAHRPSVDDVDGGAFFPLATLQEQIA